MARKAEIISFKVDGALAEALATIDNRSDFIRKALLQALGNACPVCQGTGTLTVHQMEHWAAFSQHHHMETCDSCNESHIVCDHEIGT